MKAVCSEYRIHNADVHLKEDCDVDDLVDCIEGSRVYIPCIYVLNKIDQVHETHIHICPQQDQQELQICVCTCCLDKSGQAEQSRLGTCERAQVAFQMGLCRTYTCHAENPWGQAPCLHCTKATDMLSKRIASVEELN